jgi:hypothetical protein
MQVKRNEVFFDLSELGDIKRGRIGFYVPRRPTDRVFIYLTNQHPSTMKCFPWLSVLFLIVCFSCHKKNDYPYGPPAVITSISPDSGHFATVLRISGNHFDSAISGNTVLIDSVPATILYAGSDSLVVSVPTTHTGHVVVKTAAGSATGPVFTYLVDVLVSGFKYDFTNGSSYSTALYWDNGAPVLLTDGLENAGATCIGASGNDIYAGGFEYGGLYRIAKIWKNGVATALNSQLQNAQVNALFVSGKDIYAAGFINTGAKDMAAYWKNGALTTLTDGTASAYATSIVISGRNIYIAGYLTNATQTVSQALIWNNGQLIPLTDSTMDAKANSIAGSGNDVYVGGYLRYLNGRLSASTPVYWKNGTPTYLSPSDNYGDVNSIAMSGYYLFMTGSLTDYSGTSTLTTWSSGPVFLGPPLNIAGEGSAIVVDSTDVYVTGELLDGYYHKAHYWKNQTDSLLDKGVPTIDSYTTGLYIRH